MSCHRFISEILTLLVKAGLKFVAEMLFNKHCYFYVGQNLQEPVVFMKSYMEDLEFYFKCNLGGILFRLCYIFISCTDMTIFLLDSYKYFKGIFCSVLLAKPFLQISVYLLLFTEKQFPHTKEKKPVKYKDGSQSDHTEKNNS